MLREEIRVTKYEEKMTWRYLLYEQCDVIAKEYALRMQTNFKLILVKI